MRKALFFYYNLKKIAAEWHRMLDRGESQFLNWFKQKLKFCDFDVRTRKDHLYFQTGGKSI